MKKRRGKSDKNNIAGIYNYCDAWCERCYFTSRCLNFQMRKDMEEDTEIEDADNEKFWEAIADNLTDAADMLRKIAEEMNVDLSNFSDEEIKDYNTGRDKIREKAEATLIAKMAKKYCDQVHAWHYKNESLFALKEKELGDQLIRNYQNDESIGQLFAINDAIDIIMWYHIFIYIKLMRALQGAADGEQQHWSEIENITKDSDGSAKIALVAIDRSISAWVALGKYYPDNYYRTDDFIIVLGQLRSLTQQAFPEARNFIRPGFDE